MLRAQTLPISIGEFGNIPLRYVSENTQYQIILEKLKKGVTKPFRPVRHALLFAVVGFQATYFPLRTAISCAR